MDAIIVIYGILSYNQLINDYHHILTTYSNDKSYELIEKTLNINCNIDYCEYYKRNNRIHECDIYEEKNNNNSNASMNEYTHA